MGGRGVVSGQKEYGTEYETLYQSGNIKFVRYLDGSATAPLITKTRGRVYVTVNAGGKLKSITYYNKQLKRYKQIDLDHKHTVNGVYTKPHMHRGYMHGDKGDYFLSWKEIKMVDRIEKIWYNHNSK